MKKYLLLLLSLATSRVIYPSSAAADVKEHAADTAVASPESEGSDDDILEIDTQTLANDPWKNLHPYEITQQIVEKYKKKHPRGCPTFVFDEIGSRVESDRRYAFPLSLAMCILGRECIERGARYSETRMFSCVLNGEKNLTWSPQGIACRIANILETPTPIREFAFNQAITDYHELRDWSLDLKVKLLEPHIVKALIPTILNYVGREFTWGISTSQLLNNPELRGHYRWTTAEDGLKTDCSFKQCMISRVDHIPNEKRDIADGLALHLPPVLSGIVEQYCLPLLRIDLENNLIEGIDLDVFPQNTGVIQISGNPLVGIGGTRSLPSLGHLRIGSDVMQEVPTKLLGLVPGLRKLDLWCKELRDVPQDMPERLPYLTSLWVCSDRLIYKDPRRQNLDRIQVIIEAREKEQEERDKKNAAKALEGKP